MVHLSSDVVRQLSAMLRPDVASASEAYAQRFAGEIGRFLLDVQTNATLQLLAPWRGGSVLDVGGGHAQLALPLTRAGYRVTVLCSDAAAAVRPRQLLGDRARIIVGDLMQPPVHEKSFDVAICFRLLPHVEDHQPLLAALCRAARHAALVDFPVRSGFNALSPYLFGVKKWIEGDTRPYRLFRVASLCAAFTHAGFGSHTLRREFFLPMALHRLCNAPRLSCAAEKLFDVTGLTALCGSPAILRACPDEHAPR